MPKNSAPKPSDDDVELHPDAWERFEAAVGKAVKAPPVHQAARHRGAAADADGDEKQPSKPRVGEAEDATSMLEAAHHNRPPKT